MAMLRLTGFDRVQGLGSGADWLNWVNDPGSDNLQDAFEGGEPASRPYAIIDLSSLASRCLGQQFTQSQRYRLRGLTIGFRPHEGGTNNESEVMFSGRVKWYANTDHFKDAMSLARSMERASEEAAIDEDSFFLSNEKDYSALRVGWGTTADILHQTSENMSGLLGWTLDQIGAAYNTMTTSDKNNALFNGRFPGLQGLGWTATSTSGYDHHVAGSAIIGSHRDFVTDSLLHEAAAGLLVVEITHSSIASYQGLDEDEYQWWIGVDFEVVA